MKRSTAVEILQATLDLYYPDTGYDHNMLAKSMLETVEKNVGMMPPLWIPEDDGYVWGDASSEEPNGFNISVNKWEPEYDR